MFNYLKHPVVGTKRGIRFLSALAGAPPVGSAVLVATDDAIIFPYDGPERLDQQSLVGPSVVSLGEFWQSFTAGINGYLSSIQTFHSISGAVIVDVARVYRGEGTGGEILYEKTDLILAGSIWRGFRMDAPVPLTFGEKYTIYYHALTNKIWWCYNKSDIYSGGGSSLSLGYDFAFQTFTPDI